METKRQDTHVAQRPRTLEVSVTQCGKLGMYSFLLERIHRFLVGFQWFLIIVYNKEIVQVRTPSASVSLQENRLRGKSFECMSLSGTKTMAQLHTFS